MGTGQSFNNSTYWDSGTAPTTNDDLFISSRTGGGTLVSNFLIGSSIGSKSITLDNSGGNFASATVIRANQSAVVWTFGTAGTTLFSLIGVNANISNNSGNSLGVSLSYSGLSSINVDSTSTLTFNTAVISGTGGIIKTGAGILGLNGSATYAGGLRLDEGTVKILGNGTVTAGAITNSAFGTGTLTLNGGTVESSATGGRAIQNAVNLNGTVNFLTAGTGNMTIGTAAGQATTLLSNSTLDVDVGSSSATALSWDQKISGAFSLTKNGDGRLVLNGANNYTGGFTLNAGTVEVSSGASRSGSSIVGSTFGTGNLTINGGAIENGSTETERFIFNNTDLNGTLVINNATSAQLTWTTTGGGSTRLLGSSTLTTNGPVQWTQTIAESGGSFQLTKNGASSLQLGDTNTFTGGMVLQSGLLTSNASSDVSGGVITNGPYGTGTLTLQGGTLGSSTNNARTVHNSVVLDGSVTISPSTDGISGAFTFSTAGGGETSLASDSTIITGNMVTWNQSIAGDHSLTKEGAGTLVLNGTNTFTGGLNINAGTVTVDSPTALGSSAFNASAVVLNGGTLAFAAASSNATPSANRGFQIGSSNGTIDLSSGRNVEILGNIADVPGQSGGLTKIGSGTLTLSGTNTYSGGTTLDEGILQGDSSSLQGVIVNNAALVFDQTSNGTYSGDISGTGSLTKSGSGILTVAGVLDHAGATIVSAGTLNVTGSLAGSGVTVASGATLAGSGTISAPTTLTTGSFLAPATLTFNSSLDLSAIAGTGAGSLLFTLTSPDASDTAFVNGTLSIGDGLLTLADFSLNTAGISSTGTFTLFQSDRAVSGLLGSTGLSTTFGGYRGTLALSGDTHAVQFTVSAIPEPSTYAALIGVAAVTLAIYRRRR